MKGAGKESCRFFFSHGDRIHSLQFQFVKNGTLVLSDKYGCTSAPKFNSVELNYPSELITGISGYCGNRDAVRCQFVTSISFITNKATYGPFGYPAQGDNAFDFQIGRHNKFCGFHGTSNVYLYSIGLYMKPMTTLCNVNILQEKGNVKNEKV
ncbi:inactive protein RESTRICTED TEV MOVEMENT 1-like [Rhododendron vialii]|uniref:inactive protein RESTRICTED TEV MOVEMENT 1-like n=1 Tax=Rhododendron vialii TaxID=182163 RepID=UPI00265F2A80|nr:inactive protein RESTRICTED TEV MOVEMENT 1-like [Rhododendron vialii]